MKTTQVNKQTERRGFGRMELVAIIGTLGLLAVTLLPAVAGSGGNSKALRCMGNLRRLTQAWLEYSTDHQDRILSSTAWLRHSSFLMTWGMDSSVTNTTGMTNVQLSPIAAYVNPVELVKCPADHYHSVQNPGPRARSVSMNMAMGSSPTVLGNGFNGDRSYYGGKAGTYVSLSCPTRNSLSSLAVFLDEHPDSIFDATLAFDVGAPNAAGIVWRDLPGSFHDGALSLSYADGHCELHRWLNSFVARPVTYTTWTGSTYNTSDVSSDYRWLDDRMPYR